MSIISTISRISVHFPYIFPTLFLRRNLEIWRYKIRPDRALHGTQSSLPTTSSQARVQLLQLSTGASQRPDCLKGLKGCVPPGKGRERYPSNFWRRSRCVRCGRCVESSRPAHTPRRTDPVLPLKRTESTRRASESFVHGKLRSKFVRVTNSHFKKSPSRESGCSPVLFGCNFPPPVFATR